MILEISVFTVIEIVFPVGHQQKKNCNNFNLNYYGIFCKNTQKSFIKFEINKNNKNDNKR